MLLTPLTRPLFLLTPLREGRPCGLRRLFVLRLDFYSRPCGRGDVPGTGEVLPALYFYSRPCGRGDPAGTPDAPQLGRLFLLTPLREGRRWMLDGTIDIPNISTHAPAGGATSHHVGRGNPLNLFLLTPLREGRPTTVIFLPVAAVFLLTPLREGRRQTERAERLTPKFLLTPLREGRPCAASLARIVGFISTHAPAGGATETTIAYLTGETDISTHAPAGGATAIFHKSVMRFCGKLPKDDTVLCLASFGFPRRDPKAVYLAWISCANLPQKCVRQGLALKDQGTSCFHVGLASHAFDPVLV